jgi:glycosyltransferase involved in cell wall biosynthesis
MWQSAELLKADTDMLTGHAIEYKAYLNLIPGQVDHVTRNLYRLRRRLAGESQKWLGLSSKWAISHAPEKLYRAAVLEEADLYAAHAECAFYAGRELSRAGKKVSFDFEDWYSRDYLVPQRPVRLLQILERYALKNGLFCTAASGSMAKALQREYGISREITIIYNSFPEHELSDFDSQNKKDSYSVLRMIWTSRTVGPGRGLETLITALRAVEKPVELHIIGKCNDDYRDFLQGKWPYQKGHKLVLHEFIPHRELLNRIAQFDLGLAIEEYKPDSRNTTVTNKILQYLQAGLQVLATDTEGQKEVASFFPDLVHLVHAGDPEQWARELNNISPSRSIISRQHQQRVYNDMFSWSKQEEKLRNVSLQALHS